jgi:PAS domain S-box-containing protein
MNSNLNETEGNTYEVYQKLLNQLNEIVFSLDESKCFSFLNPAWTKHTGHTVEGSLVRSIFDFMPEEDQARFQRFLNSPEQPQEFRLLTADQELIWFECALSVHNGKCSGSFNNIDKEKHNRLALQHSEERFRHVVESVAEILFQTDQHFILRFLNPAWQVVTGYSIEQSIHQPLLNFILQEDHDSCLKCLKCQTKQCHPCRQEFRVVCADGQLRWMSMLAKSDSFDDQATDDFRMTGAMLDITERKQMELALRVNEERYAILSSSTTDGVWDWDLSTNQVYFSPRWKSMLGYREEELKDDLSSWQERVHPDDLAAAMADVMACVKGKEAYYENIHRLQHKEGHWLWILDRGVVMRDEKGKPYRMVGTHADVTRLKKTEDALLQRDEELLAIFSLSPDGILTFSDNEQIKSVNPAFLAMMGIAEDHLIGISDQQFEQFLYEITEHHPHHTKLVSSDSQVYFIDLQKLSHHPSYNAVPVQDETNDKGIKANRYLILNRTERQLKNHGISKVIYFRDITVENEIDRMKSQFLSTAAHELRTPMASVFGFSELLLSRSFDQETTRELLTTIHGQSDSLVKMLNQLLDLARIESRMGLDFEFETQSLWPIINRSISELLMPGDERAVICDEPEKVYWVYVDADKLRQVITNVLSNAYKYSPQGGEIRLRLIESEPEQTQRVGIHVSDQGLGMTKEQLQHIYERFWRADDSGEIPGTGLGMCLVKEIMDIHQGTVEIQSAPGQGTSVILWLQQK